MGPLPGREGGSPGEAGEWRSIQGVTCLRPHNLSLSCHYPSLTEETQSREAVIWTSPRSLGLVSGTEGSAAPWQKVPVRGEAGLSLRELEAPGKPIYRSPHHACGGGQCFSAHFCTRVRQLSEPARDGRGSCLSPGLRPTAKGSAAPPRGRGALSLEVLGNPGTRSGYLIPWGLAQPAPPPTS